MPDLNDMAIQAAETIQTAHIKHHPNRHDIAPSTAADKKQEVVFDRSADVLSELDDVDEDEIPLSVLKPLPDDEPWGRRPAQMMPLPDMRFEQSYLKSIESAQTWQMIAYITVKDQVLMPLIQGLAWTLIIAGWRHMNEAPKFAGQTLGARIRRWWWGVNNWHIPNQQKTRLR